MKIDRGNITPHTKAQSRALGLGIHKQEHNAGTTVGEISQRTEVDREMAPGDSIVAVVGLAQVLNEGAASIEDPTLRQRMYHAATTLSAVAITGLTNSAIEAAQTDLVEQVRAASSPQS